MLLSLVVRILSDFLFELKVYFREGSGEEAIKCSNSPFVSGMFCGGQENLFSTDL